MQFSPVLAVRCPELKFDGSVRVQSVVVEVESIWPRLGLNLTRNVHVLLMGEADEGLGTRDDWGICRQEKGDIKHAVTRVTV